MVAASSTSPVGNIAWNGETSAHRVGTPGIDLIIGTDGPDSSEGPAGDDVLCSKGNDEAIFAGAELLPEGLRYPAGARERPAITTSRDRPKV